MKKINVLPKIKKESKRKNKQYTFESWMMANAKEGDIFYSEKLDRHLTAIATHHSRKISTERVLVVTTAKSTPECRYLVKVTIL